MRIARAGIFLGGLYALQKLPKDPGLPEVTTYWASLDEAYREKEKAAKSGQFERFWLRGSQERADVFNAAGKSLGSEDYKLNCAPDTRRESEDPDLQSLLQDGAQLMTGDRNARDLKIVASYVGHGGATAASRANYLSVMGKFIKDLASDEDRAHVAVLESPRHRFKVSAVVMRLNRVSQEMQNRYLDHHHRLSTGFPIDRVAFESEMSRTFAYMRRKETNMWMARAWLKNHPGDDPARVEMTIAGLCADGSLRLGALLHGALQSLPYHSWNRERWDDADFEKAIENEKLQAGLSELMGAPRSNI